MTAICKLPLLLLSAAIFTAATTEPAMKPLATKSYDAATLAKNFPLAFKHPNKQLAYDLACPKNATHTGTLTYSRWTTQPLPKKLPDKIPATETRQNFFTYDPQKDKTTTEWHLNFAHSDLFLFYASPLLAQDELQVAEHPILAHLREALLHDKLSTRTVDSNKPTPILIQNVQRRIKLHGLYGNAFAKATPDAVHRALTTLDPPTFSNIIAIAAPAHGKGNYTADQIRQILTTATTAFAAAKIQSSEPRPSGSDGAAANLSPPDGRGSDALPTITIHTGFWGCGAFGNNRQLITICQLLAARLAQTDTLIYHTVDAIGLADYQAAEKILNNLLTQSTETEKLITLIEAHHFRWGQSDGN
ncbi:MAG: poly(ADP-ribose) glycohydrolase [Phycisphaerales bacterium]|nr:poly(ADP-ribose) glycohydrolase [Phycisphaerales bacterium]